MGNLIRNGSFARANLDFWEKIAGDTLEVTTDDKLYGSYSGRMVSGAAGWLKVRNTDYIDVSPLDLLLLNRAVKSVDIGEVRIKVLYYDGDYQYIETIEVDQVTTDASWQEGSTNISIPANASYMQIQFEANATGAGKSFYFDAIAISRVTNDQRTRYEVKLCDVQSITGSGNTEATKQSVLGFAFYRADMKCYYLDGTAQTLDIDVVEKDRFGTIHILGSFAQLSGSGSERIDLAKATAKGIYAVYTTGGTVSDGWFAVSVTGSR